MRSKQIVKSVAIGAFVLLAATCQADSELSPYLSFTVPGLDGAIEKIELADIDGDDFTEVLASDGHKVVLFSFPNTILFTDTLDSGYPEYELELADVNRDSVADIAIGLYYKGRTFEETECRIVCYDSALGERRLPDQVFFDPDNSQCSSLRQTMLKATDYNGDGYNELIFSFERSILQYGWWWCKTEGDASIYYSYPDSLLAHLNSHVDGLWGLPLLTGYPRYLTHKLDEDWWALIGPDYTWIGQNVAGLDSDGTLSVLIWSPGPYYFSEDSYRDSEIRIGCLIDSQPPLTLICAYAYNSRGYWPDSSITARDTGLAAYGLHPSDSTEQLWYRPIDGYNFTNFIAHPTFPDQFFAMAGDTLMRFDASDGSLLKKYNPLPQGMKFWDYPYGGDYPYLIIVNHDTVSYYGFGVVTDVDVGPGNRLLPSSFTLGQPYPNPFNPTVTLPITLKEKGHLTVEVFNPLGQKVATIHNATTSAGEFDLTWDATGFSSGMYLLRATLGNESKTVKAVLLK